MQEREKMEIYAVYRDGVRITPLVTLAAAKESFEHCRKCDNECDVAIFSHNENGSIKRYTR